eukprot:GHVP01026035.1.p1 GENE.GHVP01026035.1~~GHVP01026035.1.p1  ORF type:complete len:658 (+),score=103.65 GHVP01026035.1:26-1975(+)
MTHPDICKSDDVNISYQHVGLTDATRNEKVHVVVFETANDGSLAIANEIATLISKKASEGKPCVLGLATGSTPIRVYQELVRRHREEKLSFSHVVTYNLDEYYPMKQESNRSYWHFMHEHLFNHVDIKPENINIPRGDILIEDVNQFCIDYEAKIESSGGLDLQILGIGRTGHIGFNEPGSHEKSLTRLITLDHVTKVDAAGGFQGINNVPTRAVTMGIATIQKARRILLAAWGHSKSSVVLRAVEGQKSTECPATFLQGNENLTYICDEEAASDLTRFNTPWLVGPCEWTDALTSKSIIWLSSYVKKPILKLLERDYNNNGMSDLLAKEGSAYKLNIKMFNKLSHTITGWPGGKPNVDDSQRPERKSPSQKKIIIFSPHPDDDVISMGGTFLRLVEQGHDVHVCYQTSGNLAVSNAAALHFAEVAQAINMDLRDNTELEKAIVHLRANPSSTTIDPLFVRKIKGLIRKGEARAAARFVGVPDEKIHFLDLPFYESGTSKKFPLSAADTILVSELIRRVEPHQIFAAGDLADPHGTHKVCLDAIFASLAELKNESCCKNTWLWLYRGAWQEWPICEIEMAVPLSPAEVEKKRIAIFFHQTQKDGIMFQGEDDREFWQRAEARNADTACLYRKLGLTDYAAIEAFRRWHF